MNNLSSVEHMSSPHRLSLNPCRALGGINNEALAGIMGEIELLRGLNHPNIVKYIGSFKTRSHLYIIMEVGFPKPRHFVNHAGMMRWELYTQYLCLVM
jgi:serine/threonine protein kinase